MKQTHRETRTGHYQSPGSGCDEQSVHSSTPSTVDQCTDQQAGSEHSGDQGGPTESFLRSAQKLNPQLLLTNKALVDELAPKLEAVGIEPNSRSYQAALCLLANLDLVTPLEEPPVPVSLSLSKSSYSFPQRYGLSHFRYAPIKEAFTALKASGLVEVFTGSRSMGLRTRFWASDTLQDCLRRLGTTTDVRQQPYDDEILLKGKDKRLKTYKNLRERNRMRNAVRRLNDLLRRTELSLAEGSGADRQQRTLLETHKTMVRIFNEYFTRGGRFYGGGWQLLPSSIRRHILINGQPVAELDYRALHPSLLYAQLGLALENDPYVVDGRHELRDVGKQVLLIALNAKDRKKAIGALKYEFFVRRYEKPEKIERQAQLATAVRSSGMTLAQIYDLYKEHHAPISSFFGRGMGTRLQRLDAMLMERILGHFVRKGVVCLGVHDSVIIAAEHADELEQVMQSVYQAAFHCPIGIKRN